MRLPERKSSFFCHRLAESFVPPKAPCLSDDLELFAVMVRSLSTRLFAGLIVAFGLIAFAPNGKADVVPAFDLLDSSVEFVANYTLHIEGSGDYQGTVVHAPGRERRAFDTSEGHQVLLVRRDLGTVSMLWPANRTFLSVPLSMATPYIGDIERLKLVLQKTGTETINGEDCTVYTVSVHSDDRNFKGRMWFTPDGILMKAQGSLIIDGIKRAIETQLSQLVRSKADPNLFNIPPGYWGLPLMPGATDVIGR